jgi:hypothetical protein
MGIYLKRGKYVIDFYADGRRVRECLGTVSRRVAQDALKARQGEVVQGRYKLLGHASIETTMRYSHSGARELRRAVALLSDGHHMDTAEGSVVPYDSSKSLKTQPCAPVAQLDRASVS